MTRHLPPLRLLPIALLLLVVGCGDETASGLEEPLRVERAAFRTGPLPGVALADGDPAAPGPAVTLVEIASGVFHPRGQQRRIAGRVSPDGAAIALQLDGLGTGYWIRPTEGADALAGGEQTFELEATLGEVAPGPGALRLVALDERGVAGPQRVIPICVASPLPDNLNACDPTRKPPAAIISLRWGAPVDLDLVVVGPGGEVVDARRPFGASGEGGVSAADLLDPTIPRFTRDSNAGCLLDGLQREEVVFPEPPAAGTWLIQARLFDACGAPGALGVVEVHRRLDHGDGTWSLIPVATAGAHLLAEQGDGGATPATYLLPLTFP